MIDVTVMYAGRGWLIETEKGQRYNGGRTGKDLVKNCNEQGYRIKNRGSLTPELESQLKY